MSPAGNRWKGVRELSSTGTMIDDTILERLRPITPEERSILNGSGCVDWGLYNQQDGREINAKKLLDSGKLISIRPHTRFIRFPAHTHDYVELVYMCQGTTTHIANGTRIQLQQGELLFLGQGASHEILPAAQGDLAVNFIIQPPFFDKALEMLDEEETPLRKFIVDSLNRQNSSYLYFKVANVLPIQNLVENLLWTLIQDVPNKRRLNQTTMGLLLMQLINHADRLIYESEEDEAVVRVFRYIEENYRDGSLTELAGILHYDMAWLSRQIKQRTGKSYTEHLQEKRMSQAAYLLKNTTMHVDRIAQAVGYSNIRYFHQLFRARYGLSPKKYRDSHVYTTSFS